MVSEDRMFRIGDPVVDRDSEDPDIMRVLDPDVGQAVETEIPELGRTVHQVNPGYPPFDPVVETIYETWLDSYAPDWDQWAMDELNSKLESFTDQWSVSIKSYYYPESRLKPINSPRID